VHVPGVLADTFEISRSRARMLINAGDVSVQGHGRIVDFDIPRHIIDGKEVRLGRGPARTVSCNDTA
jgi:hypothetical protein